MTRSSRCVSLTEEVQEILASQPNASAYLVRVLEQHEEEWRSALFNAAIALTYPDVERAVKALTSTVRPSLTVGLDEYRPGIPPDLQIRVAHTHQPAEIRACLRIVAREYRAKNPRLLEIFQRRNYEKT